MCRGDSGPAERSRDGFGARGVASADGLRLGAAVLDLNASQAVAWRSTDAAEREEIRAALRRRARAMVDDASRSEAVEIRDRREVLERVEREP